MIFKNNKVTMAANGSQMNGEKIPGDLSSWDTYTTDNNLIVQSTYGELSKRSMTLYHTGGPAAAAINKNTEYAIGQGLVFRSQPDWEILGISEKKAKAWGLRFQKLLHYYLIDINFYQKQSILFRTALAMGDSLLFFDRDKSGKFDLIEAGGDQIDWQYQEDGKVTLGIIHDDMLRRKGIVKKDGTKLNFKDNNGDQNVIQFYFKDLSRQLRGFPLLYKIINLAKNHDRFMDAKVQRAVLESITFAYTQTDTSDVQKQAAAMAEANKKLKTNNTEVGQSLFQKIGNVLGMGGGNIYQMKGKEEIKFTDLKTPANNFDKFNEAYLDIVGMATDTPPEVVLSRYNTSFTAHKGALNDFIKAYTLKRSTFSSGVCYPVIREIAKYFILNGIISAPGFFENTIIERAWLSGNWLGPVPGTINPLQEVNAHEKAVANAFTSRSNVSLLFGNEYENYMESWKDNEDKFYSYSPEKKAELMQMENKNNDNGEINEDN